MRTLALAAVSLAALPLSAQDRGAWIARLGTDTVALETYQRTTTGIRGEIITRSPIAMASTWS